MLCELEKIGILRHHRATIHPNSRRSEMPKPEKTGSIPNHIKCKAERRRRKDKVRRKHWREKQELKRLAMRRAEEEPKPTPIARGYLAQRFWEALHLDKVLERVGITKMGGVAVGCILLMVLLFGVMNVTSLSALATEVGNDLALCAILGVRVMERKMLYRTLAAISVSQYQAWMGEIVQALQQDPRTASQPHGVVAGDETQVAKRYGFKMPGIRTIFLHCEKVFTLGYDIASTHYADWQKDYPLFFGIYQPDQAKQAEIEAAKRQKKLKIDRRKPADFIRWVKSEMEAGNQPQVVELVGNQLNQKMRHQLEKELEIAWVGVSDQRRVYVLEGEQKPRKAKDLLSRNFGRQWVELTDVGSRVAFLGEATCTLGRVMLVVVEQMDDAVRQLYVLPPQEKAAAIARLTLALRSAQEETPAGKLHLMLELLELSRKAGIRAETAVFDRWYLIPWFLLVVLKLGFKRVVVPAKAGFNYEYQGQTYDLPELWKLWCLKDFEEVTRRNKAYRLLSRQVKMKDLGKVQVVFVEALYNPSDNRKGEVVHRSVLMCTDLCFTQLDVLRAYKLRWKIEVCYRECKQNHGFSQFHARTFETIYGQLCMSLLAYVCVTLTRLLTKKLKDKTLGWIKDHYFNSLVKLAVLDTGEIVIEFSGNLLDNYGLPDFDYQGAG